MKDDATVVHRLTARKCMQFGGDIAFVPATWGHTIINHTPSIAMAYEHHAR